MYTLRVLRFTLYLRTNAMNTRACSTQFFIPLPGCYPSNNNPLRELTTTLAALRTSMELIMEIAQGSMRGGGGMGGAFMGNHHRAISV